VKLPKGDRAVVDLTKLRDYCLNPAHLCGRHKARVFAATLGVTARQAELLRAALLQAARDSEEAVLGEEDGFGKRYVLDFNMAGPKASGSIRALWIVRMNEAFPRLTSCYVL